MAEQSASRGRWPAGPGLRGAPRARGAAARRRAAPGTPALLMGALALALAARAASQGFAAGAGRAAPPRGPGARRRAAAAGGGPDADVWKEAAAEGGSPMTAGEKEALKKAFTAVGEKQVNVPQGAAYVPDDQSSQSRIKQFLALEPIPDDPSEGNQWEVDAKSADTSQDEFKKLVAIGTGGVSIFVSLAYLVWVIVIENRDFQGDLTLSKEDVASISSLFPDGE